MRKEHDSALVRRLALEFIDQIRSFLTPEEIAEVVERNSRQRNPHVCHTHDFIDANELMQDAFQEVFPGVPWYERTDRPGDGLWEDAWDLAKAMQFDPAWPLPNDFQI